LLGTDPTKPSSGSIFGYICLFFVVVTWIAQSEVAQAVETSSYNRPYIITYVNHSLGLLQGLVFLRGSGLDAVKTFLQEGGMFWKVLAVCMVYQLADWAWYIGLTGTSVADGTILFNSMSVFVFLFEWLLGRRKLSLMSGLAILVSLVGVVMVQSKPGVNNASAGSTGGCLGKLGGNALVLVAAILYAVYQVAVDAIVPSSNPTLTNAFVAVSGFVTLTMLWPVATVLPFATKGGCLYEPLDLPSTEAVMGLALTGLLAFAFNVLFCFAIVYTSPLVTAVGCMLTVPASLLTDYFLHNDPIGAAAVCGSTLVVGGFLVISCQASESDKPAE